MANKTFSVPITADSVFQAAATASGSVSGDTTTITSIALNVPDDMWAMAVGPDNFPKVTIIDGKQYRWTIKAKKTTLGVTYVQKATLNIGTKLVINKPFFTIKYGENPVSDPSECVRSFYDLGRLTYYGWDPGASDIEITGNESVPRIRHTATRRNWQRRRHGSRTATRSRSCGTKNFRRRHTGGWI